MEAETDSLLALFRSSWRNKPTSGTDVLLERFRAEEIQRPERGSPDLHAAQQQRSALHVHSNHQDVHEAKT